MKECVYSETCTDELTYMSCNYTDDREVYGWVIIGNK